MPASRLHISFRVFGAFVAVGLVMLTIAAVFVLGIGQGWLRNSYGDHLTEIAEQAAAWVDSYVYRRVIAVTVLARVPDIREEAAAASRRSADTMAIQQIDREWQRAHAAPPAVADLFDSRTSRFLVDITRHDPIYREILVADRSGRLTAASGTTSDYLQADEDWWTQSFAGGSGDGRVFVGGVVYDDSARCWALEVAVPVEDPSGGAVAGVLKAIIDVREMVAAVSAIRLGSTGEALLLRDDGSIVLSRRPMDPAAQFFAPDLLRERLQAALKGQQTRMSFGARDQEGQRQLVGIALSQLRTSYPALNWMVAVSQSEDELFTPVRAQLSALIIVLALTAVAVLALALWFSVRLTAPIAGTDLRLVEHPPVQMIEEEAKPAE